ncbi:hypothetical protein Tco_1509309 [Tanacetum coccineum]
MPAGLVADDRNCVSPAGSQCTVFMTQMMISTGEVNYTPLMFHPQIDEDMIMKLKGLDDKEKRSDEMIHMSDIQRQLYKALVDAYEADKILLDTYGDTVTIMDSRRADVIKNLACGNRPVGQKKKLYFEEAHALQEFEQVVSDEQPGRKRYILFLTEISNKLNDLPSLSVHGKVLCILLDHQSVNLG